MAMSASGSSSPRDTITLTSPKRSATLYLDKTYHSVPATRLFPYVEALIKECGMNEKTCKPVYILKFIKTCYDKEAKPISELFDLVDIIGYDKKRSSFFQSSKEFEALQDVRRVFVSNGFFMSAFNEMQAMLPPGQIVTFSNVAIRPGWEGENTKMRGEKTSYYSWSTSIITNPAELNKYMNLWRKRSARFESEQMLFYSFKFVDTVSDVDDEEEEVAPLPSKRSYRK